MMRKARKRKLNARVGCAFGAVVLTGACASPPQPVAFSLCQIVKEFERYQGQLVILRVSIFSDAIHQSSLQDLSCPEDGATLSYSDLGVRNGSAERVRQAIFIQPAGTLDKSIDATVTGRLTRESIDAGGLRVFVADSVTDIKVTAN